MERRTLQEALSRSRATTAQRVSSSRTPRHASFDMNSHSRPVLVLMSALPVSIHDIRDRTYLFKLSQHLFDRHFKAKVNRGRAPRAPQRARRACSHA